MFFQLFPIHWGLVDETFIIENLSPTGSVLPPVESAAVSKGVVGISQVSSIGGRGRVKKIGGSGIVKPIGGRGKLCP